MTEVPWIPWVLSGFGGGCQHSDSAVVGCTRPSAASGVEVLQWARRSWRRDLQRAKRGSRQWQETKLPRASTTGSPPRCPGFFLRSPSYGSLSLARAAHHLPPIIPRPAAHEKETERRRVDVCFISSFPHICPIHPSPSPSQSPSTPPPPTTPPRPPPPSPTLQARPLPPSSPSPLEPHPFTIFTSIHE